MNRRKFFLISLVPLGFLVSKKKVDNFDSRPGTATYDLEQIRKARLFWKNAMHAKHYGLTKAEYDDILKYSAADVRATYDMMKAFEKCPRQFKI